MYPGGQKYRSCGPSSGVLSMQSGPSRWLKSWKYSIWKRTKQFWSVPFVSHEKRLKYLKTVRKDIIKDLKKA